MQTQPLWVAFQLYMKATWRVALAVIKECNPKGCPTPDPFIYLDIAINLMNPVINNNINNIPPVLSNYQPGPQLNVCKNLFIFNYVIGKGGIGKVWKVQSRKDRKTYAMKEMSKSLIITKKFVNSVMNERQLLA